MLPAISLVITAYNRDRYLAATIESILTQTRGDFELLIWDDGSTDSSVEIAREYAKRDQRVRVIVAKHLGRGLALKLAISQTTAPYIAWVDSDDLLAPTALSETAAVLDKKPDIGWVYTDYLDINEKDTILSYGYRCLFPYNREELLNKFMTFHFRLIRREVFELAGGIDESLEVEDYDLCMRLSEIAKVEHIFKPLYYYRSHPNSLSWQRSYQQIKDSYKAVVKAQKRRKSWRSSLAASFIPLLLGLFPNFAQAQSITPANDSTGTIINNQDNNINISGGSLSSDNTNLFHSFSQFGLDANQTANFLANPQIQNILGRVTGGNASVINGLIQVTGGNANLYLMNPAGIIFGGNSSLNVPAAFTATTANGIEFANNQWFNAIGTNNYSNLLGNPTGFGFTTNQPGSIFNAGNLAVGEGQSLTLLGGTVMNTGTITAPGGNIKIMAVPGEKIVRITPENSLLSVDLPLDTQSQINPQVFSPLSLPQLLTGGNLAAATGFAVENGEIKLTSTNTVIPTNPGTTIVSGEISVANSNNTNNTNNTTPEIQILGDRIALFNANINANGVNSGTVLIGGDDQGQGTVPTATSTFVSSDSIITANGLQNGGKVIVWADDATRFFGTISAKGVNGGFVETSGKNFLDVNGATVDASGSNGQAGTWLLDPTNINIVTAGTGTLTGGIFDPATNSTIAPTTIESALNSGTNVTITTAGGTGGSGDITLTNSIGQTLGGSASLTLTGRRFFRGPYGTINMNSTGALTFNINQVNPETIAPNSSIQNAINAIGTVAGGTTINLGAGTYTGNTVFINQPLTINGAGLTNTILDAQNNNSVFQISSSDTVTLNNFSILNGNASSFYGSAIYNTTSNTLNINNLAFNNNSAPSNGGAIYNSGGTINIINSTFNNNNSAFSDGGAIYNSSGTVNITNSIFSNNTAINNGGAIYNSSGTVTINNSTLSGNSSTSDGGAIYNSFGTVTINNSTLSGNSSTSDGGAIYNQGGDGGIVFVRNSTFSGNQATDGGAIYNLAGTISVISGTLSSNTATNLGGGIYNSSDGNILLKNTIVAGNTSSTSPDIFGSVDSPSNYNLIGNGTGIGINNGDNGNLVGSNIAPIDPKLAVLGDYGGTTQTMALLPDSPAINTAILDNDFTTDQRGISRFQGAAPDIGAFEVVGYTLTPIAGSGQSTTVNTTFGTNLQAEVTEDGFNKAIPNVSVTFNAPGSGASASFTGSNTLITDNSGIVSIPVTANSIAGSYSISANNGILTPANFSLTNQSQEDNSFEPTTIIDTNLGKTSIYKENQTNFPGEIDEKFTAEFKQYLSIEENIEVVSVNESRGILSKINNATGVQPALIYVNFVPTTISGEASQILKSDSDRLELLIITSKGEPIRKVINVTRSQVIEVARSFRSAVTDNTFRRNYKQPGKQLYDWLIQPIESELQQQKIDNLVFIMDGGLRSLPIAALYDGEKHLVERYSVGLMPSLSLTDTNYVDIKKAQVLGMGASTFIDQDPLPAVPTELLAITNQLWTGKSFLNESFTLKNLQNQRKEIPYGIIHLATHGEFQSGSASNSYIQLWDTRLKMNQLRQLGWNNPPVELVVLSACRTAIGDEQAELGFAGFAVQAGAKSALASLWYVSDEGTLGLMSEFYKQLKTSPIKAEALRQAQIAMLTGEVRIQDGKLRISRGDVNLPPLLKRIGNKDLQHPYFWSAFTMIGNPW
ncbi:CHAT domain-containing protein [Anabaena sp. UHCC 0204]|uniref:CHAT domain-containing protein n=1 Tax=Anabaena sp. UHCC 0204 TaxID=2590009 RepID=UPI001446C7C8|nr:CHAT domain-containing protein [Anabaena sp. UHCC 0204]MTJ07615.1 CHAT domain-containing protein [Anabaena sp. UHCC 0204]